MAEPLLQQFDDAIFMDQLPEALRLLAQLAGVDLVTGWIDEKDPVLYIAHRQNDRIHAAVALVEGGELRLYSETQSPPFTQCPPEVIHELDPSLDARAIAWRRDCLMRHHRAMAVNARLAVPPWTAFYSPEPLAQLQHPAHLAVVARAGDGRASLAVTDGERHRVLEGVDTGGLSLSALPELEWWQHEGGLRASQGRSRLHYLGLGPLEYRVGMLFNDLGGLVAWSACAQDCQLMANLAGVTDEAFSTHRLLAQLDGWLGRASVTGHGAPEGGLRLVGDN